MRSLDSVRSSGLKVFVLGAASLLVAAGGLLYTNSISRAEGEIPVEQGGTGLNAVPSGALLYGSPTNNPLNVLPAGTQGFVLTMNGGVPVWTATSSLGFIPSSGSSTGTPNQVARWNQAGNLASGILMDTGTVAGVNAVSAAYAFNVQATGSTSPLRIASAAGSALAVVTPDGRLGVGLDNPPTMFTVYNPSHALSSILVTSDVGDNTIKTGRFGTLHYQADEEPFLPLIVLSGPNNNVLHLGGGSNVGNAANTILFFTAPNTTTVTGTERMRITGAGNIGIGTNAPNALLVVQSAADAGNIFRVTDGNRAFSVYTGAAGNDYGGLGMTSNHALRIFTNSSPKMTVTAGGNVGVGTVDPKSLLQVDGSGYFQFSKTITTATPPAADCDSNEERGRMVISTANNRLYICNGAARKWDFINLSN